MPDTNWHPLDRDDPDGKVTGDDMFRILAGEIKPDGLESHRAREKHKTAAEAFRKWAEENPKAYLERFSTVELIEKLRRDDDYWLRVGGGPQSARDDALIREILATRPHVPNKAEAKAIRRKNAQNRHGLSKAKNR